LSQHSQYILVNIFLITLPSKVQLYLTSTDPQTQGFISTSSCFPFMGLNVSIALCYWLRLDVNHVDSHDYGLGSKTNLFFMCHMDQYLHEALVESLYANKMIQANLNPLLYHTTLPPSPRSIMSPQRSTATQHDTEMKRKWRTIIHFVTALLFGHKYSISHRKNSCLLHITKKLI
jgi:hypothetical protein